MRVLGIDPGLRITGFACVQSGPGKARLIEAGVIRLLAKPADTDDFTMLGGTVAARLVRLDAEFATILDRVRPQAVAIEGLFAHAAHPATAMVMGHARGVLVRSVQARGIKLLELKPALVKKHMTGSGRAEKAQMQRAVQNYFALATLPTPADMADALAIAVCACDNLSALASDTPGHAGSDDLLARIAKRRGASAKATRKAPKELLAALRRAGA
jgi:crossover junction endodeoxyribonuclease RuvC